MVSIYLYNPNPESLFLGLPIPTLATAPMVWHPGAGRGGGLHECKCTAMGKLGSGCLVCLLLLFFAGLAHQSRNLWKTSSVIHVNTEDK